MRTEGHIVNGGVDNHMDYADDLEDDLRLQLATTSTIHLYVDTYDHNTGDEIAVIHQSGLHKGRCLRESDVLNKLVDNNAGRDTTKVVLISLL